MADLAENLRAATLMSAAMACYTTNDAIIKLMSAHMPIGQILTLRGTLICIVLLVAARLMNEPIHWHVFRDGRNLLRALSEVGITFAFLTSITLQPLAIATTLMFAAPIFLTLIGAIVFKETVGPRRWTAVLAGFAGVVIIAAPGGDGWSLAALLPLLAALIMAFRDMLTRYIPVQTNATSIALVTGVAVAVAGLFTLPFGWVALRWTDAAGLVACALLLSLAMVLIVGAVRTGELSFVAPFRYISIMLAVTYGALLWGEIPGINVWIGGAVIAGAGLFIFHRERQLARSERGQGQTLPE